MNCPSCGASDQATSFCTGCGLRLPGGSQPAAAVDGMLNASNSVLESSEAELNTVQTGIAQQAAQAREQAPAAYLDLQDSEAAVVHAASRIFAAYVQSGAVTAETEAQLIERSTRAAIKLAVLTDQLVQAKDEEW